MQALTQNTDAWLELRKRKIGASDAPVIMNVSPWKTPYKLWTEKVGIDNENFVSRAMQEGLNKEQEARDEFIRQTNIPVVPKVCFHECHDWMMASLDGIDKEEKYIVEIKNAGLTDHTVAKNGKIPEKYFPQVQHQLEVTGLDMAYYFSYRNGEGVIVEVERDNKFISEMVSEEKKFFLCMQDFVAPKMTSKDYVSVDDVEFTSAAAELRKILQEMTALTKREEELKKMLTDMCESKSLNNVACNGMHISKCVRKGNIDYASIPELKKIDLEIFRKTPISYWRVKNS